MEKTYKIFAYGSLINRASLTRTVPTAKNIFPAMVNGLQRVFNLASTVRFDEQQQAAVCVLNVQAADAEQTMNGSCFEMGKEFLSELLERESAYEFCQIQARHYHDQQEELTAYYFKAKDFQPYRYLSESKAQRHYLDLCLNGSKGFGDTFVEDFKRSTAFWDIGSDQHQQAIWKGEF